MVQWDISGMCLHVFLTFATIQSYLRDIAKIDCLLTMGRFCGINQAEAHYFWMYIMCEKCQESKINTSTERCHILSSCFES